MERVVRERLLKVAEEYDRLTREMSSQEVASDPEAYRHCAKAQANISEVVKCFRRYLDAERFLKDADEILDTEDDPEFRQLAEEEKYQHIETLRDLEEKLRALLLPRNPDDAKNAIVEIRAGTGGEEAALFAADLFRMYARYAEQRDWKVEVLGSNPTGIGGFKEIIVKVSGDRVYGQFKFEGGVHRVQRVPITEAQGRIHTSAVTVAVLPEVQEVEVDINPADLHIDVFRSSGPGGQHVNTTDSAVRITHKPTGIVVNCQDEKSQHKNKAKALAVLRARLLAHMRKEERDERSADRKSQVGTGDRSERIRTYNFPQNRVTDHRINKTLHKLEAVMGGDLQELIDALIAADRAAQLAQQ